jgi:hypothetical protein
MTNPFDHDEWVPFSPSLYRLPERLTDDGVNELRIDKEFAVDFTKALFEAIYLRLTAEIVSAEVAKELSNET